MLSIETSALLRALLMAIATGEISIEKQRRALAKLVKFEPYAAFQRIDRNRTGFIDSMDILTFLRDNGFVEETEADTYYLTKFFDVDSDGRLNYTEFLTMVLPCDNAKLREEVTLRENYYVGLLDFLPKAVEYELCKLFVKEIAFHRRTEKIKQELAIKGDYDAKAAFKAIDDWSYKYIDFSNLKRFLKVNKVPTNKELAAIIRRLDLNADSRLSFDEFAEGIKPMEPYSKVTLKTIKSSSTFKTKGTKSVKSKKSLTKSSLRRPKTAKTKSKKLTSKKSTKSGKKNKEEFPLRKHEVPVQDSSQHIYHDLEENNKEESKINQNKGFESSPQGRNYTSPQVEGPSHHTTSVKYSPRDSPLRYEQLESPRNYTQRKVDYDERRYSPRNYEREHRGYEESKYGRREYKNLEGEGYERHTYRSGRSTSPLRSPRSRNPYRPERATYEGGSPRNPPVGYPKSDATLRHHEEKELVTALNDLLNMELELENRKIDLALKPDFNLMDLFRMFDIEGKGYITFDEFRSGLSLFHLYPTHDDAYLLFLSKASSNKSSILRYSEFCDMFSPKTDKYSHMLSSRQSYYVHKPYYRISEFFHPDTRRTVEDLLVDAIRVESVAETMRQHLSLIPTFNIMDAFNTCDMKNSGFITRDQFKLLLESHGIHVHNDEITNLIGRFDKDKDGKVSYTEFADEVRPKSPVRRVNY